MDRHHHSPPWANLALSGCASDQLERSDALWAVRFAQHATLLIDRLPDRPESAIPKYEEVGSVRPASAGPVCPAISAMQLFCARLRCPHWLIARALPGVWRPYWQAGMVITECCVSDRNQAEGIRWMSNSIL